MATQTENDDLVGAIGDLVENPSTDLAERRKLGMHLLRAVIARIGVGTNDTEPAPPHVEEKWPLAGTFAVLPLLKRSPLVAGWSNPHRETLDRMEKDGFVSGRKLPVTVGGEERKASEKRVFRLTTAGQKLLADWESAQATSPLARKLATAASPSASTSPDAESVCVECNRRPPREEDVVCGNECARGFAAETLDHLVKRIVIRDRARDGALAWLANTDPDMKVDLFHWGMGGWVGDGDEPDGVTQFRSLFEAPADEVLSLAPGIDVELRAVAPQEASPNDPAFDLPLRPRPTLAQAAADHLAAEAAPLKTSALKPVPALIAAAIRARDALDDIQDEAKDIVDPVNLKEARRLARKAFYPLADALDRVLAGLAEEEDEDGDGPKADAAPRPHGPISWRIPVEGKHAKLSILDPNIASRSPFTVASAHEFFRITGYGLDSKIGQRVCGLFAGETETITIDRMRSPAAVKP